MCAQDVAESLGLTGWVRNRPDGTVELVAEGEDCALSSLLTWCRRGPNRAEVSDVEVAYSDPTNEFDAFCIGF
jgi:acylphosphatase